LAHRIEAGADLFLMPSRFEPCGLNQMYSLRYGTAPVVHETGGLADTIVDLSDQTLAAGTANGFRFREINALALSETLRRACECYRQRPDVWRQLQQIGMHQDWSWRRSAQEYVRLYEATLARARLGA
jgi:starch synthase